MSAKQQLIANHKERYAYHDPHPNSQIANGEEPQMPKLPERGIDSI
jgi:hypothetical protein